MKAGLSATLVALVTLAHLLGACSQEPRTCDGAGDPRFDATFVEVQEHRRRFGRVIFFFGDSISRGYALGTSGDMVPRDRHGLWPVRSPASMLNMMLRDAGVAQRLDHCGDLVRGDVVAAHAGGTGQPNPAQVQSNARRIRQLLDERTIRAGDVVVLEDAGDHHRNPDEYEENWLVLRRALADADVTVIMMTMYDQLEGIAAALDPAYFQYDAIVLESGRSHNQATVAAASQNIGGERAALIDLHELLRRFDAEGVDLNVRSLRPDGIHPNVWGQCVMAAAVARTVGIEPSEGGELEQLIRTKLNFLGSEAPSPASPDRAAAALALCGQVASATPLGASAAR